MVVPVPSLEKGGGFCGGFAAHPGKTNSATETTQQNTYQPRQDGDERGHDRSVMVSQMKGPGEIRKEARAWKSQLLTAKARTKIGTWNVRTLYSAGKLAQVLNEMKRYHVDIMGINEMRWTDCGKMESDGFTIYYSGGNKHERGVGIILTAEMARAVIAWEPVNDRIITIRLQTKYMKITLIQVYAPTNAADDKEKDEFYEVLQAIMDGTPEHDMKLFLGDCNAQVGKDNTGWEETMGREAIGTRNENGERLLSYCSSNKLKVGGSIFKHRDIHLGTWRSPNGQTVNQIDHICYSRRWASSVQDVRAYRGADVGSDHYLVMATLKVKLKVKGNKKMHKILDIDNLRSEITQCQFRLELNNRFSALEQSNDNSEQGIEETWTAVRDTIVNTAQEVIGYRRGTRKERWITKHTWAAIDERRQLKAKKEQAFKTGTKTDEAIEAYRTKDKEVKSRCRVDKEAWFGEKLVEAETAAGRGDSKTLYRIVKELSGKATQKLPINDANGKPLKTQEEQANRWKEHFQAVLNCSEPNDNQDLDTGCGEKLKIEDGDITIEEVIRAIKKLKNGKSAGVDGIQAELLKNGGDEMVKKITTLCNQVWKLEQVPKDWKDGIIIPLPKKGDLKDCNNWRGIALLSVPGKVMSGIILERIKAAIDCSLRQQQAGFRKGRSCCDQIFTLRHIIEKVTALDTNLIINFIDFKKAFDCLHRPAVWKILTCYGIPEKIIRVIQNFYKGSRCAVRSDGKIGDWFQIITGVKQGCLLSPLIFLIVMDWILKHALDKNSVGLDWVDGRKLADLDFADDIALLSETWTEMQKITNKVEDEAKKVGLHINTQKTKLVKIGKIEDVRTIQAGGGQVEEVEQFCYLGSVITNDSSCDKEIKTRLGKANTTFGRLTNIWRNKSLNVKVKVRLYDSLVLSTLKYGAETWSMTAANMKKLEAAHHKWLRRILGITWRDMVTNEEVRKRTGMGKIEDTLRKSRLRWFGHMHRMDTNRLPKQVLHWTPREGKRRRGRPRKNWNSTIVEDLRTIAMSWEEAETSAGDRTIWRSCVARCAAGTGRTKV